MVRSVGNKSQDFPPLFVPPSPLSDIFPVAEKNESHYNSMQISLQTVH